MLGMLLWLGCYCTPGPASLAGSVVFPRPDKNTLDHQLGKTDFVEVRRLELERYLRKLAAHPVVGQSEVRTLQGREAVW
jgi:hypothetical protein